MPVPLAIAAPATAAALAYLNAKTSFSYDWPFLKVFGLTTARVVYRRRNATLNFFYELEHRASSPSSASRVALIFEGRRITYAQLYDRALRMGAWLRAEQGVRPGDIVAMDFENSDTFIVLWWGLWSINAKPAFINYNMTGNSLVHCVKAATAKLCVVDPAVASAFDDDAVRSQLDGLVRTVVLTPELLSAAMSAPPTRLPDADLACDDPAAMAMLIYTSGTTGLPKAAHVPWQRVITGGILATQALGRGTDSVMYTSMPLYHSAASILSFCCTVTCGGTQALGRRFSTKTFWREVRESDATIIQYVGETLRYLLAAAPEIDPVTGESLDKKHRVVNAFGNGLRPDIWNKFKDRFGVDTITEFYAATEGGLATFNVSSNDLTAGAIGRSGWVSRNLLGGKVHIVEVDWDNDLPRRDPVTGYCTPVEPGTPGEMIVKLPDSSRDSFQGYHGNPKATAAKILRDVFEPGDAYFRTGDVIRRTDDGITYFNDRIGDTFRWKSENVSTAEVSEAVGLHPSVHEANVYGVELPHHDGRAGCAAISFEQGSPSPDTLRSLAAHVKSRLPRYAQPIFLRLVKTVGDESQTTGTNKQQKHHLRVAGVRPSPDAQLYWLSGETYVPFEDKDWRRLEGGQVKL